MLLYTNPMQDENDNVQATADGDDDDEDDEKTQTDGIMPSPPMEIEGIVRGEPDTGIVQSGGNVPLDDAEAAAGNNQNIDDAAEVHTISLFFF